MCVFVTQSYPTLCNSTDCSPPGSSVHGILKARRLDWVAIPFSRGSSWFRDRIWVSCTAGRFFYCLSHQGSPKAAVTKPYKLGDLKEQKCVVSQFWRSEVWNQGVSRAGFLWKAPGENLIRAFFLFLVETSKPWCSSAGRNFTLVLPVESHGVLPVYLHFPFSL